MKKDNSNFWYAFGIAALWILLFAFTAVCFSCSSHKQITKSESKKDSTVIDKSKIKTIETTQADTIVKPVSDSLSGSIGTQDTAETVIKSNGIEAKFKKNKKTGKTDFNIKTDPAPIAIKINTKKITEQENNIKTEVDTHIKDKHVDKVTSFGLPWWVYLLLILLLLIILLYKRIRKYLPWIP